MVVVTLKNASIIRNQTSILSILKNLRTAILPDTACCGSFLLDSQGEFLYSPSPEKQVFITTITWIDFELMAKASSPWNNLEPSLPTARQIAIPCPELSAESPELKDTIESEQDLPNNPDPS